MLDVDVRTKQPGALLQYQSDGRWKDIYAIDAVITDMSYGIGGAGSVPEAGTLLIPWQAQNSAWRSDTQGKKPAAGDAEYGELFINYPATRDAVL